LHIKIGMMTDKKEDYSGLRKSIVSHFILKKKEFSTDVSSFLVQQVKRIKKLKNSFKFTSQVKSMFVENIAMSYHDVSIRLCSDFVLLKTYYCGSNFDMFIKSCYKYVGKDVAQKFMLFFRNKNFDAEIDGYVGDYIYREPVLNSVTYDFTIVDVKLCYVGFACEVLIYVKHDDLQFNLCNIGNDTLMVDNKLMRKRYLIATDTDALLYYSDNLGEFSIGNSDFDDYVYLFLFDVLYNDVKGHISQFVSYEVDAYSYACSDANRLYTNTYIDDLLYLSVRIWILVQRARDDTFVTFIDCYDEKTKIKYSNHLDVHNHLKKISYYDEYNTIRFKQLYKRYLKRDSELILVIKNSGQNLRRDELTELQFGFKSLSCYGTNFEDLLENNSKKHMDCDQGVDYLIYFKSQHHRTAQRVIDLLDTDYKPKIFDKNIGKLVPSDPLSKFRSVKNVDLNLSCVGNVPGINNRLIRKYVADRSDLIEFHDKKPQELNYKNLFEQSQGIPVNDKNVDDFEESSTYDEFTDNDED